MSDTGTRFQALTKAIEFADPRVRPDLDGGDRGGLLGLLGRGVGGFTHAGHASGDWPTSARATEQPCAETCTKVATC